MAAKTTTRPPAKSKPKSSLRPKKRSTAARKRLPKGAKGRGPSASEMALDPATPSLRDVVATVEAAGGRVLAAFSDPLSGAPHLLAALPLAAIEPTEFQRDLSPTHAKRLAEKIDECGVYLDPVIAVPSTTPGPAFRSPNGRHRLAAARVLGLRSVTALVSADPHLAFRILALNTEKAHNLKDRSLEVIRMARALAARRPPPSEAEMAAELEGAHLLTLGIAYEAKGRFSGGAWQSILKKTDRFSTATLARSLREREGWASRLLELDERVAARVAELSALGFRSPYLKALVVARINPIPFVGRGKRATTTTLTVPAALTKMLAAVRAFRPESVRMGDLALLAGAGAGDEG